MPVTKTSSKRWEEAQAWELSVWQEVERSRARKRYRLPIVGPILRRFRRHREGDDWNRWWAERFEHYQTLPSEIENYVELGCGPYTNTRLILRDRKVGHVVCSDPLIKEYIKLEDTWVSRQCRAGRISIDDHPIEECPFADGYFDVVVMTNVLDHVRDAGGCLENAVRITKPGGHLVIGQELSNEEDVALSKDDPGHPIFLGLKFIVAHLRDLTPVLRRDLGREEGRNPSAHFATMVYIGKKHS
jgi:SAM-dependent methyltransferase